MVYNREWIKEILNSFYFVNWDKAYLHGLSNIAVYGWINQNDFIVLKLDYEKKEVIHYHCSDNNKIEEINEILGLGKPAFREIENFLNL